MIVQGQSLNGKIPFSVSEDVHHISDDEKDQENQPASMQFPIDNIETHKPRPDLTWLSSVGNGQENGSPNLRVRTNKKATLRSNSNGGETPKKDYKNVFHQLPKSYETLKNFKDSPSSLQVRFPRKNTLGINNPQNVLWAVRELCCSDVMKQVEIKDTSSNNLEPKEYNSVTKSHDHVSTWHGDDTDKTNVIFHAFRVSEPTNKKDEGRYDENETFKASRSNKRLHIIKEHKEPKRKHCSKHHGKGKHVKKSKGMIPSARRSHSNKHVHRERSRTHAVYKRFHPRNQFGKTFHHGLWRLQNMNAFRYPPRINRPFWVSKYHVHSVI